MHAVILAGGLGTRLRGAVADRPKAMADIGGRPFLEHLLLHLRGHGVEEVVLCTGYLGEQLEAHFGDGGALGLRVAYSRELEPLGTGGALKLAQPLLRGDRWLVLNGDTFFDAPHAALVGLHRARSAALTMALARVEHRARFGAVELAPDGRVTAFESTDRGRGAGLVNGGVYVVERQVLELIPAGRAVSLEVEILPQLVGHGLYGLPVDAELVDIGTPESYARARIAGLPSARLAQDDAG